MRIAIVTVYDSIVNYGSYLQAYALNSVLKDLGHDVYFVRRMSDEKILDRFNTLCVEQNKVPVNKSFRVIRQLRRNRFISTGKKTNKYRYKLFKQDWNKFQFIDVQDIKTKGIELIICGSDEIWNLHNKDVDFKFYSCGWSEDIPKIAYAISSGDTRMDEFFKIPGSLSDIADFDVLLPRDEDTQRLLEKITDTPLPQVCDPTILWGHENYVLSDKGKEYGKYLLVYSYYFTKREKEYIIKYARKNNLKIISPCIHCDFADENVYVPSLDFPSLIANAECTFSSTFHGTIFSLMFARRFCCFPRFPKVKNLLECCGALDVSMGLNDSYERFEMIINSSVNRNKINQAMDEMRSFSIKQLGQAIERIQEKGRQPLGLKYKEKDSYYYGYSLDEESVRKKSSSGGLFFELAQSVLKEEGIVFGAVYDEVSQTVRHCSTDEVELSRLMRSKYAESHLGETFCKIENELKKGRKVLFCGTPCQAAGLRAFSIARLGAYKEKLFIVDFLCEGVPSDKVFLEYQKSLERKYRSRIKDVIFRSKAYGWNTHCMKVVFENGKEYLRPSFTDPYMHSFLIDLMMNRSSCYQCRFRDEKMSDITIADFWKAGIINDKCRDNKGVSAIFVHTDVGQEMLNNISDRLYVQKLAPEYLHLMNQHLQTEVFYDKRNSFYRIFCEAGFDQAVAQLGTSLTKRNAIKNLKKIKAWVIWTFRRKLGKY